MTNDTANPSTANISRLDQIITKLMSEVGVQYPVTNQLRTCFKSKLWRMGQKISEAGPTKRKQILDGWKTGKDSIWDLHINASDVNNELVKLQQEREKQLASQCLHGLHLEKELKVAEKEITRKTSQNQELSSLPSKAKHDLKELQKSNK